MTAAIKVVQVPEGSVLLLSGVRIEGADGEVDTDRFVDEIVRAVGHEKFVVITHGSNEADVDVWGPDVDLRAKVAELLEELK